MTARPSRVKGRSKNRWVLGAVVPVALAMLTACGGAEGGDPPSDSAPSVDAGKAAALVPPEFKDEKLTIVVGAAYPPYHYENESGELDGFNPALAEAIGKDLGIDYEVTSVAFETLIAGMQSDRYDLAVPGFNITPERLEILDFVTYVSDPTAYMTKSGSGVTIDGPEDLCGLKMAVAKGTAQEDVLRTTSDQCESDREAAIEIQTYSANTEATTAVRSGRADGATATYSQLAYAVNVTDGAFELAKYVGDPEPLAIGLVKGHGLGKAVEQAVKDIIASGVYQKILEANGVADMAIDDPKLVTSLKDLEN